MKWDRKPKIFIASSFQEFKDYRNIVKQIALEAACKTDEVGPLSGLTLEEVIRECQRRAANSDLVVLFLGAIWGAGVTEKEFHAAHQAGLDLLVYITQESKVKDSTPSENNNVKALRKEVTDFNAGHWSKTFSLSDPNHFREVFRIDLQRWRIDFEIRLDSRTSLRKHDNFRRRIALLTLITTLLAGLALWKTAC